MSTTSLEDFEIVHETGSQHKKNTKIPSYEYASQASSQHKDDIQRLEAAGLQYKRNTQRTENTDNTTGLRHKNNITVQVNFEHDPFYRVIFSASFFRDVGFVTKRAADFMISLYSDLQDICRGSVDIIMRVVTVERQKVYTYMQEKYKPCIDEANTRDQKISQALKYERAIKDIEIFKERAKSPSLDGAINSTKSFRECAKNPSLNIEKARAELANIGLENTNAQVSVNHFDKIARICKLDPSNHISVKITSYIRNNKLAS